MVLDLNERQVLLPRRAYFWMSPSIPIVDVISAPGCGDQLLIALLIRMHVPSLALALGSTHDSSLRVNGIIPLNLEKVSDHGLSGKRNRKQSRDGASRLPISSTAHRRCVALCVCIICPLSPPPLEELLKTYKLVPQARVYSIVIHYKVMSWVVTNSYVNYIASIHDTGLSYSDAAPLGLRRNSAALLPEAYTRSVVSYDIRCITCRYKP